MREATQEKRATNLVEAAFGPDSYVKRGKDGEPDREVMCGHGLHFWVEWKTPTGDLTAAQKIRIPRLRRRGDLVLVLTDATELIPHIAAYSKLAARLEALK